MARMTKEQRLAREESRRASIEHNQEQKRIAVEQARRDRPSGFEVFDYTPIPIEPLEETLRKFDAKHGVRTIMDDDSVPYQLGFEEGLEEGGETADTTYQNALARMQDARTIGKLGKSGTYITFDDRAVDAIMTGLPDLATADPEESRNAFRQHVKNAIEKALDEFWCMLPKNVKN